jgi:hypothetical protein
MQILQHLSQSVPGVYAEHPMVGVALSVAAIAAAVLVLGWVLSRLAGH